MKSNREQIMKLCEEEISSRISPHMSNGIIYERERLTPIITALLDRVEQLEGKVDKSYDLIWNQILLFSHNQDSMLVINSEKINKLFVLKDELKQALDTSPLDKLLEGEVNG